MYIRLENRLTRLKKGGPGGPARMRARKFLRKKPVFSIRFTSFTKYYQIFLRDEFSHKARAPSFR